MNLSIVMPLGELRGGGEISLLDLVRNGQGKGITWSVIFLEAGPLVQQVADMGSRVHVVPSGRLRDIGRYASTVRRISALLREDRAELVVGWMWKASLYSSPAAILAGVPAIWYQLEAPLRPSLLERLAFMLPARGVMTVSRAAQARHARLWPRRPVHLVYPGVSLERFDPAILVSPEEARRRLGLPCTGPLIGIVGRLQRWKGIHTVIEAMPRIMAQCPEAHCVIVGGKHQLEPNYPDYLAERSAALGLNDKITLAGLQINVPIWMQAMDVIIHASDNEPFGMVVVEGMALGKPMVAGANGGPTEIVTHGVDGLFAPYENTEALAAAVLRYLENPEFAGQVGAAARRRALDFSNARYAENFVRVSCGLAGRSVPSVDGSGQEATLGMVSRPGRL
ncbi:glycosyltransferase family 4 protein [Paracraurococcus lichenis]|uniref:Glycosyltransferase family 4 protein n=1 Tax=Paracraurococcus lichenis TaxID=3064888 RepID=A0ABT9EAZ0_9PROT|nr:glycosyltransferase family 4 protein [Paracraurococcus sp. LOR1-02]MDO9713361.1 glycosyltransferase family 4 protein [Paracraurococcus sp. LOR1-02]